MAVSDSIQLETCWGCHAHQATQHQVDAQCSTCHVPLAETSFDLARIESIPEPSDHEAPSFLETDHGRLVQQDASRCATCHTRQRCVACHVDTNREAIAAFPPAPGDDGASGGEGRVSHAREPRLDRVARRSRHPGEPRRVRDVPHPERLRELPRRSPFRPRSRRCRRATACARRGRRWRRTRPRATAACSSWSRIPRSRPPETLRAPRATRSRSA